MTAFLFAKKVRFNGWHWDWKKVETKLSFSPSNNKKPLGW
jgi:hypothetical protein